VTSDPVPAEHAALLRRATALSVLVALGLACAKLAAFVASGSISLLASLVDSALDASASLITAAAVRYALKPADDDHRFGHGKSEALAGLAQAVFIASSAVFLIWHAIARIVTPKPIEAVPVGIAVMLLSIVATAFVVQYQRRVVRITGSQAIRGDAMHYVSDLVTNVGTIAALGLAAAGMPQLDAVIGVAIAGSITYGAAQIGWDTFQVLMDRELPEELQAQIRRIALEHRSVTGVHDLRTRRSGHAKVIQLHLEMDGRISLHESHRISDEVERAIRDAIPGADVVIHQDPEGLGEEQRFV
jgi:ferrous-iron efflux pump FieF